MRRAALRLDTGSGLLAAARGLQRKLPGDEKFGDPLSTAGDAPVQLIARSVSAMRPDRESLVKELGLARLQVWQSLSEATGRGRGEDELALLFTDLVGFSTWALGAGDAAVFELLREVGVAAEAAVVAHDGTDREASRRWIDGDVPERAGRGRRGVRRAGRADSGSVGGYQPRMRAGVHWGRPRLLGGDYPRRRRQQSPPASPTPTPPRPTRS